MLTVYDMLKYDEGIKYKAYKDTKGNITVGIGFNMDNPAAKGVWLKTDINESFTSVYVGTSALSTNSITALLNTCIDSCRQDLETIFPDFLSYSNLVQLALINLMFNMGKSTFSTFLKFIGFIRIQSFAEAAIDLSTTLWAKELPERAKRVVALLNDNNLYP